jgi:hypothetical protein
MSELESALDLRSVVESLRRPPPVPPYSGPDAELLALAHEARLHRARAENAYRQEVRFRHLDRAVELERRLFAMTPATNEGCLALTLHFLWRELMDGRNASAAAGAWARALVVARDLGRPGPRAAVTRRPT